MNTQDLLQGLSTPTLETIRHRLLEDIDSGLEVRESSNAMRLISAIILRRQPKNGRIAHRARLNKHMELAL